MNKSTFFVVGKHAVIGALKNPIRKVLRLFLTEESKKNIHKERGFVHIITDFNRFLSYFSFISRIAFVQ